MFPHFLCIGAQKAGTTWLHHNLSLQPGIWLPPVKEIHFFDHTEPSWLKRATGRQSHLRLARAHARETLIDFVRGKSTFLATKQALRLGYGARDWNWYEAIFPDNANLICGEVCPGYARLPEDAIGRIVERNAAIKVIYLLRDPVDRAHSNWTHLWSAGLEPEADFLDACRAEPARVAAGWAPFWHYTGLGLYGKQIEHLYRQFPREQVLVLRYRELKDAPAATLDRVCAFLGVRTGLLRAIPNENVNLLVVEDNAVNRKVAVALLDKLGYVADTATDGIEALEAMQRTRYDVVLMDCQMPRMDGYEATAEIRRRENGGEHTPVVAMTASAMATDRERCLAEGMDDYLAKPIDRAALSATLRRCMGLPATTA